LLDVNTLWTTNVSGRGGVATSENFTNMDVCDEPTWTYLWRVYEVATPPHSPCHPTTAPGLSHDTEDVHQ
jgi:hypothetical protein